jgi:hypothetical protein
MATAFAGPLSRFFAKTTAAAARLRPGVETWREDLRSSVAEKVAAQLDWDEAAPAAFSADLGDSGWMALRLFAYYAERSDLELPDTVPPLLELDPEWRAAADQKFARSRYGQLLACRVWLPGDFPITWRAPLPDGDSAEMGSIDVLAAQLAWLNQRTFQADADEAVGWGSTPAPPGAPLLSAAQRGYAGLLAAVQFATGNRLPVLVREA